MITVRWWLHDECDDRQTNRQKGRQTDRLTAIETKLWYDEDCMIIMMMPIKVGFVYHNPGQNLMLYSYYKVF